MLEIKVREIRDRCPMLRYTTILEHDWCPVKLGLTTPEDPEHAYMQCVDPGEPYTEGGTVIFECRRLER